MPKARASIGRIHYRLSDYARCLPPIKPEPAPARATQRDTDTGLPEKWQSPFQGPPLRPVTDAGDAQDRSPVLNPQPLGFVVCGGASFHRIDSPRRNKTIFLFERFVKGFST